MKKREKGVWFEVLQTMREIVPGLEDIEASYLHTKTLGLFFKERTSATPWAAEDVSDGTIHALSLLVASVDAESSALVIEEIENSAHPWIIRTGLLQNGGLGLLIEAAAVCRGSFNNQPGEGRLSVTYSVTSGYVHRRIMKGTIRFAACSFHIGPTRHFAKVQLEHSSNGSGV